LVGRVANPQTHKLPDRQKKKNNLIRGSPPPYQQYPKRPPHKMGKTNKNRVERQMGPPR